MKYNDILKYWSDRAVKHRGSPSSTTQDIWLRKLEISLLKTQLKRFSQITSVLDIGCGDGYGTISLAKEFPGIDFVGADYSKEMIFNAKEAIAEENLCNVRFIVLDALNLNNSIGQFDAIISDRCLINLPSQELQKKVIENIYSVLDAGGLYLMIENFIEGHQNFNSLRKRLGLPEIPVRWHNNFFSERWLVAFIKDLFEIVNEIKFASTYYLVTRVVFSKLCHLQGIEPPYDHPIYEIASMLDPSGDFAPMRFYLLKKR